MIKTTPWQVLARAATSWKQGPRAAYTAFSHLLRHVAADRMPIAVLIAHHYTSGGQFEAQSTVSTESWPVPRFDPEWDNSSSDTPLVKSADDLVEGITRVLVQHNLFVQRIGWPAPVDPWAKRPDTVRETNLQLIRECFPSVARARMPSATAGSSASAGSPGSMGSADWNGLDGIRPFWSQQAIMEAPVDPPPHQPAPRPRSPTHPPTHAVCSS